MQRFTKELHAARKISDPRRYVILQAYAHFNGTGRFTDVGINRTSVHMVIIVHQTAERRADFFGWDSYGVWVRCPLHQLQTRTDWIRFRVNAFRYNSGLRAI